MRSSLLQRQTRGYLTAVALTNVKLFRPSVRLPASPPKPLLHRLTVASDSIALVHSADLRTYLEIPRTIRALRAGHERFALSGPFLQRSTTPKTCTRRSPEEGTT